MYRKEEILSLLKEPADREADNENDPNHKPGLKWHKVNISYSIVMELQRRSLSLICLLFHWYACLLLKIHEVGESLFIKTSRRFSRF